MFRSACALLALFGLLSPAFASPAPLPEQITFQGRLTDASGNPVANGALSMTFTIYDAASDGTNLWTETQPTVVVTGGLYSVNLGAVNAFPADLVGGGGGGRWLGIAVGTDPEMTSRYVLTSAVYARRALAATLADTATAAITANTATSANTASNALQLNSQPASTYLDLSLHTGVLSTAQLPTGGTWTLLSPLSIVGSAQISGGLSVDTIRNNAGNAQLSLTDEASFTETRHENIAIPDGVPTGVDDNLVLPDQGIATKILVSVHVTNPDVSTLRIELTDPTSSTYLLKNYGSGSGTDYSTSWPVPTLPVAGDLSVWNGKNPTGTWRLHVIDNYSNGGADGNIVSWSIKCFRPGMTITGQGSFTAVSGIPPLQVATPYATGATVANLSADLLDGLHANALWNLGGNTVGATGVLGTNNNYALELTVNNTRALRLEPNATSPNVIGGNAANIVTSGAVGATIGGGGNATEPNWVTDDGGTVAGGSRNQAGDNAGTTSDKSYATVGGGYRNTASGNLATVSGGENNTVSGWYATVGGGYSNIASGWNSFIGGGRENLAGGTYSFAAGCRARIAASHYGTTLFADNNYIDFNSAAANEFASRATGGVRFVTGIDGSGNPTAGVHVAAGGGSWSSISDRNAKEHNVAVDGRDVLDRLAAIPIETWNYKSQNVSIRHIGPMAQDFKAAFGVGEDDIHITTVDADGVALAAIQGLYQVVKEKDAKIAALETRLAALERAMGK